MKRAKDLKIGDTCYYDSPNGVMELKVDCVWKENYKGTTFYYFKFVDFYGLFVSLENDTITSNDILDIRFNQ